MGAGWEGGGGAETDEDPVSDIVCNSGIRESGGGEGKGGNGRQDGIFTDFRET